MTELLTPQVISALIQVPLVLSFMVFALQLFKSFRDWQTVQNKDWHERMEQSENTNREFLREQREAYGQMVNNVVSAIRELSTKQGEHSAILTEHDRKLDMAVAEMRARVGVREEDK